MEKFSENSGLGISLEANSGHHYIRSVLPEGPVGRCGKLFSGDELLEVRGPLNEREHLITNSVDLFILHLPLMFTEIYMYMYLGCFIDMLHTVYTYFSVHRAVCYSSSVVSQ